MRDEDGKAGEGRMITKHEQAAAWRACNRGPPASAEKGSHKRDGLARKSHFNPGELC